MEPLTPEGTDTLALNAFGERRNATEDQTDKEQDGRKRETGK